MAEPEFMNIDDIRTVEDVKAFLHEFKDMLEGLNVLIARVETNMISTERIKFLEERLQKSTSFEHAKSWEIVDASG